MAAGTSPVGAIVIRGGRVYNHDGDVHKPRVDDVLIKGSEIVGVGPDIDAAGAQVIDARNRLVLPGLINAHYHSHDTLCRGLFEELPLEFWLLYTLPLGRTAARRRCGRARWSERWSRFAAASRASRTCWGSCRSTMNRRMSSSRRTPTSACVSSIRRWFGTCRLWRWSTTRTRCRQTSR